MEFSDLVVPVVRVADPQVTAQRVSELGGVVWVAPDEAPSKGDTALIGDTTGALLLIQRWPPRASAGGAVIMKQFIRLFVNLLTLSGVLLVTGCSSSGGGYGSGGYDVYDNYGYPHYGYGYGRRCCYDDHDHDRPDRPNRDGTRLTRPGHSGGGMGPPARMSRGGGFRGGGRGR
ncbi:MAG: VOC family protein [Thiogranum sp.]